MEQKVGRKHNIDTITRTLQLN